MRARNENTANTNNTQYPKTGETEFYVAGYVQRTYTDNKNRCDYANFDIMQDGLKYTTLIEVQIPHSLNIVVEPGDHLEIQGIMRTRPRKVDGYEKVPFIMLEARKICELTE